MGSPLAATLVVVGAAVVSVLGATVVSVDGAAVVTVVAAVVAVVLEPQAAASTLTTITRPRAVSSNSFLMVVINSLSRTVTVWQEQS